MPERPARLTMGHVRLGVMLGAALLLVGCSATPERSGLPVTLPATFSAAGGAQAMADRWWLGFGDPGLAELVDTALAGNFSLRAAAARLRQANAVARREGAPLWPTLDARGDFSHQDAGSRGGVTQRELGLFASYELDLWGRVQAGGAAADFDAQASAADLQTAALTLSAAVANTWYQLVEQRAQLALIARQIATNRQLLKLVEARFRIGQATASDVFRQRQLLAQTEGEQVRAQTQRRTLSHQLAILLGSAPGQARLPDAAQLPTLGPLPATGVPAQVVQRRPDLRSAFQRLRAADARAAAAVAARYPQLDLSASIVSPGATGGLLATWIGNLAAQLTAALFDGGRSRAEVERTGAVVEENLNSYGQVLLEALGEVEDALVAEAGQRNYLDRLDAQLRQAAAVVGQEHQRYFQGDSDYLSVLDALRSRQTLERQQVTARRELLTDRVALVRALAGGWTMAPRATEQERID